MGLSHLIQSKFDPTENQRLQLASAFDLTHQLNVINSTDQIRDAKELVVVLGAGKLFSEQVVAKIIRPVGINKDQRKPT